MKAIYDGTVVGAIAYQSTSMLNTAQKAMIENYGIRVV